jgi:site-specific DNA recombinase
MARGDYEGTHEQIVSDVLFDKSKELLKGPRGDLERPPVRQRGRAVVGQHHLLRQVQDPHVGVSTRKQGKKFPYYLCNKRWRIRECDQDYVRADLLEAAIIKDIRTMLRDEDFMTRLWAKANELLVAEKPALEKELARIDGQIAKTRAKLDRYFEAFEAGTMKPDLCNQKVKDLTATLEGARDRTAGTGARKNRLRSRPSIRRCSKRFE